MIRISLLLLYSSFPVLFFSLSSFSFILSFFFWGLLLYLRGRSRAEGEGRSPHRPCGYATVLYARLVASLSDKFVEDMQYSAHTFIWHSSERVVRQAYQLPPQAKMQAFAIKHNVFVCKPVVK